MEISLVETNGQRQAMIFSHSKDPSLRGNLIWASSVTKTVTSVDIVKNGMDFQAVVSVKNIVPFSDNTANILIIPILKTAANDYEVP